MYVKMMSETGHEIVTRVKVQGKSFDYKGKTYMVNPKCAFMGEIPLITVFGLNLLKLPVRMLSYVEGNLQPRDVYATGPPLPAEVSPGVVYAFKKSWVWRKLHIAEFNLLHVILLVSILANVLLGLVAATK